MDGLVLPLAGLKALDLTVARALGGAHRGRT